MSILAVVTLPSGALGLGGDDVGRIRLNHQQSVIFRQWMVLIANDQIRRGASPRWVHRDCAGLVRYAVHESFANHSYAWIRANGLQDKQLPPPLMLDKQQMALMDGWVTESGKKSNYVSAISLIQGNSRFISKNLAQLLPGDLLFFDQGDDQHLMIYLGGNHIGYHTGKTTKSDTGLRLVTIQELSTWKDSRWQVLNSNPNFIGIFRLSFLTA
ncbi:DUF1175 family protein [Leeia sp. TBRC 13508]|uniref:DUF1175 family protein n=1 Tax=Leeia speluncae TaxID=2884804 RepID=A0ABS8D842_9NEIS|nr:DUF1175 family protein [Leeia speluncae]MCB6184354.1 DUF1175 family protein [Leeia speluncae]